jgi:hypothetical protein
MIVLQSGIRTRLETPPVRHHQEAGNPLKKNRRG